MRFFWLYIQFGKREGFFKLTLQRELRFFEKFTHTPFSVGKIGAMVSRLNPTDLADQGFQALPFHW